jgi:predicted Zn-ribbon and HTH transcriptional regulator
MSSTRAPGIEALRRVLAEADEPLTAREIHDRLRRRGVDAYDSSYRVATVLGRAAERGGPVEVIDGSPYRYRLAE